MGISILSRHEKPETHQKTHNEAWRKTTSYRKLETPKKMNAHRLLCAKNLKHEWKDYKKNVQYTEVYHQWTIEIEYGVPMDPDWFDPEYDDYSDLEGLELEKGHNFYITKNGETFQSLWIFKNSGHALSAAKDAIKLKIAAAEQGGTRIVIPRSENPYEI